MLGSNVKSSKHTYHKSFLETENIDLTYFITAWQFLKSFITFVY